MNKSSNSLVQEAIGHLTDILSGTCTIKLEQLDAIQDQERTELFAGLLFLHEDLELRQSEMLQAQAQRDLAYKSALNRSRQQFELIMSEFEGVFWVLDHDLAFLQVGESPVHSYNSLQPQAGVSLASLIGTKDPLLLSCRNATLGTRSTLDWVWRGRTYQATIAPYAHKPDAPLGAAVVAFDVTEQRHLQERLNQSDVLKGVFTAMHGTVAYEVKHWGEVDEEIV
ncbi:MAG: hypothetical protein GWP91_24250, partial [Rhodobacterales bacterium]|nr:hypothetical protein [Rhodobacterales bacterium]